MLSHFFSCFFFPASDSCAAILDGGATGFLALLWGCCTYDDDKS